MNGEIYCESEKGRGSKFTFYIEIGKKYGDDGLSEIEQ